MVPKLTFILQFIIITVFVFGNSNAQVGFEDAVYLKNGSIIHGIIIEQRPNELIKIQTKDRNIFVYRMDEIEKIGKENTGVKKWYADVAEIKAHPYSGFSVGVELAIGSGTGSDNNAQSVAGVHAVLGYLHKSILLAGISAGFNQWNVSQQKTYVSYNPLDCSIALRFYPIRNRLSLLFITDIGYAIENDDPNVSGGFVFNCGAGCRFNLTQKRAMSFSICYRTQHLNINDSYYQYYPPVYEDRNIQAEGICLVTGFTF